MCSLVDVNKFLSRMAARLFLGLHKFLCRIAARLLLDLHRFLCRKTTRLLLDLHKFLCRIAARLLLDLCNFEQGDCFALLIQMDCCSVELFNRTCDEARDWMLEKMTQLDTAELGPDLKTVQALQRRHQHLERELAPIGEKVNRVYLLANSVESSYPNERANVNVRRKEIQDHWSKVKAKALERRSRLEDAVGHQIFMNSSKNLVSGTVITAASVDTALSSDRSLKLFKM